MIKSSHNEDEAIACSKVRIAEIASRANVNRAYWEKVDDPAKTVVLANSLSRADFQSLNEIYFRELSCLKLKLVPIEDDSDLGRVIVRASKSSVDGIPSGLLSRLVIVIAGLLQDPFSIESRSGTTITNCDDPEPDAHIIIRDSKQVARIRVVLESVH
jgi:hypothetical protein